MIIYVYSYGGFAREFERLIRLQNPEAELVFIDDQAVGGAISYAEALAQKGEGPAAICLGFADAKLRRAKSEQAVKDGFELKSVIAPTSIVGSRVSIADGCILSDFSIITADATIGTGFHCNIYSYIAHDCVVGDYVTLAPRVSVSGRVHIGDHAYIGTGATILPGKEGEPITIGEGAIVGAHALVTQNVAPGETVVGCPARPLRKS